MQNRHFKKNLKAFTLTEVLVTMALSSILVIVTYMAYNMLGTYFQRTSQSNDLHSERLSFRMLFSREMDQADSILHHENILSVYHGDELRDWGFGENTITRGQGDRKTFAVGSHVLKVEKYSSSLENKSSNLVSGVTIAWPDGEDSTVFRFYKEYPLSLEIN